MEIKNILICTLRYVNYNDEGLMKNYHIPFQLLSNLVDTLNSIKSFNVHTFFFDEHLEQYPGSNFKISLINLLREKKPDLIVFDQLLLGFVSPVHSLTNKLQKFEIPFYQSFFYYIKKNLKIPLVICWTDLQLGLSIDVAKQLEDYVTLHNVWDIKRDESFGKNYLFTPSPINSEVYNNLVSADRYIDISFVGSIGSKPDRQKILNSINKLKLNSEIRAGGLWSGKDTFLTDNQCADIYRRSKMVINFCLNEEGKAQIKGRVFETTLCGALLLEQENNETSQYLTPYIDYIPWKDENDLIEKIKYYLSHDEERKAITLSGSEKANKLYTGKVYWELLLKKINNVLV